MLSKILYPDYSSISRSMKAAYISITLCLTLALPSVKLNSQETPKAELLRIKGILLPPLNAPGIASLELVPVNRLIAKANHTKPLVKKIKPVKSKSTRDLTRTGWFHFLGDSYNAAVQSRYPRLNQSSTNIPPRSPRAPKKFN
jgi:hypothetical protein